MNKDKLKKYIQQILNEDSISSTQDTWAWVSPDNQIIKVPKLNHKGFIMRKYKDAEFGWDYDKVFDKAIKDGWVRVIYEYVRRNFTG